MKVTDFHTGLQKYVKGKMKNPRSLDGFDFNISKEHIESENFLNVPRKKYNQKLLQKHLKDLKTGDDKKINKLLKHYKTESLESLLKILSSRID